MENLKAQYRIDFVATDVGSEWSEVADVADALDGGKLRVVKILRDAHPPADFSLYVQTKFCGLAEAELREKLTRLGWEESEVDEILKEGESVQHSCE